MCVAHCYGNLSPCRTVHNINVLYSYRFGYYEIGIIALTIGYKSSHVKALISDLVQKNVPKCR